MYGKPSYEELWDKALNAVESNRAGFTLKTGDVHTANDLSGLLGAFDQPTPTRRKLRPGTRTTVTVAELDTRLRRGKFGNGLRELLETLTGQPVVTTAERREIFAAELTKVGLAGHPWVGPWLDHCQKPRCMQSTEVRVTAQRCAAILTRLVLNPHTYPEEHTPLESLADIYTGDSAGLGPRRLVGQLVMRAVSSAHSKPIPTTTYERWLSWLRAGVIMDDQSTWDVFISHAHEDKIGFVRPLATALREAGLRVWYDEYTMVPGDSIRESIDKGIQRSQAGLLVMSPYFFRKFWTKQEVNGLFSMAAGQGTRLIPVLHGLDHEEFTRHSPMLADRYAIRSEVGVDAVVDGVLRAVGKHS
ncbi:TIR domain-containing protein [Saccharothrix saharensis]|uniref:TIR domain-containing protein n=2 Tax=Saccharothrix saharensis TaxID=571190 RepID=A0A543JDX4_9PSEU|nr:TIR domain-containing protein [Saccharothrix saharensis]